MAGAEQELSREELDAQTGEPLPKREVMSLINPDPNCIVLPPDGGPFLIDDPHPNAPYPNAPASPE